MKKFILLAIVSVMACGGGGGGGGGGDNGSAPDILSVELYQYVDGERIVKTSFIIDEIFSMQMTATDPDRDMEKYYVDIVGPKTDDQRQGDIPPADTETVEIYDYQNHVYDFFNQFGAYDVCFWIVDGSGNESEEFCITVTVTDYSTG